jgi:hypothetical protein
MQALYVSREAELSSSNKLVVDYDIHPTKQWVVVLYSDGSWILWDYGCSKQTAGMCFAILLHSVPLS